MLCLGILWNSVQDYKKMVLTDIGKQSDLIGYFDLSLGEKYEQFVRDIYAMDDIAAWKVDKKIETMFKCSDSRNITVSFMNVDLTDLFYHEGKKRMVYTNLENLKTGIRKKYGKMVNYYFFDNIFHMTDNEKEFSDDFGVVESYTYQIEKPSAYNSKGLQLVKKMKGFSK